MQDCVQRLHLQAPHPLESGGTDQQAAQEMQALYAKHNISPMNLLALPLLQLPVFMSFFLGLRRLTESFPDAHAGGAYWFVDLGARRVVLAAGGIWPERARAGSSASRVPRPA